jgi:putative ABC transport system permease protein
MIKNFFITAWRSLSRNKVFTLLNVSGLAIGVAVCLLSFKEFKNGVEEKPPSSEGGYR